MNQELQQLKRAPLKWAGLLVAIAGIAASFLFQETDLVALICRCSFHSNVHFIVKKVTRVFINDFCLLLIIYIWFNNSTITRLAWKVQLVDTLILLPIYLILKLTIEGDSEKSSPLLSQLHRMIVNPTLMILIVPGVYFQRLRADKK